MQQVLKNLVMLEHLCVYYVCAYSCWCVRLVPVCAFFFCLHPHAHVSMRVISSKILFLLLLLQVLKTLDVSCNMREHLCVCACIFIRAGACF